ncbi:MgtC/SapB family protein [Flavitalea sp.]|nr:MgtC/SapB family protein [Flavitalea sp.]
MSNEDIFLRLFLAALAGGIIGAEREYRNKSAGFRTLILISLGSCLFTIASILIEENSKDRIASNIVTGIGFVGAGVIFKSDTGVKGLTTAATVWVTAAIGMAIAAGMYMAAGISALLVMIVLNILGYVGKRLERTNVKFNYKITFNNSQLADKEYERFMKEVGLTFVRPSLSKQGNELVFEYSIKGGEDRHQKLLEKLINDKKVVHFDSIDPN